MRIGNKKVLYVKFWTEKPRVNEKKFTISKIGIKSDVFEWLHQKHNDETLIATTTNPKKSHN